MTDHNPVDIGTALADLLSKVDDAHAITVESMQHITDNLNQLWADTEGNDDAHRQIEATWNHVQQLAEQNSALAFQVTASSSIAHTALEEKRAARDELQGLQDAIDTQDESHPRLRDWAEAIRESAEMDFEEMVLDGVYPEAMAEAFDEIREEVQLKIEKITGCGWRAADMFLSVIMGRRIDLNPLQEAMFKEFMETFVARLEAGEWTNGRP